MIEYCYPDFEELSFLCGSERSTCCAELHSIGHVLVGRLEKKKEGKHLVSLPGHLEKIRACPRS